MNAPLNDIDAVEAVLAGHPDVAASAVVHAGTTTVVAVVPREHRAAVDVRDDLWEAVPPGRLPDLVVVLERLPRDANGEVLTGQLATEALADPGACGFVAPQGATEVALATIWRDLLGRRRIAARDNFFDLGGDSMTSTLLLDLTNERFGVNLSFDELLEHPSLRAVAEAIDRRR
jgi:acyl carrier protein